MKLQTMYHLTVKDKVAEQHILGKYYIYFCHYFVTNKKITIIDLWHAMEPQTMYHLIAKDKVDEQHIFKKKL